MNSKSFTIEQNDKRLIDCWKLNAGKIGLRYYRGVRFLLVDGINTAFSDGLYALPDGKPISLNPKHPCIDFPSLSLCFTGREAYLVGALAISPITVLSYLMQKFIVLRSAALDDQAPPERPAEAVERPL